MTRRLQAVLALLLVAIAIVCVGLRHTYISPSSAEHRIEVKKGMSAHQVAQGLSATSLQSLTYTLLLRLSGYATHMQVGEYAFPKGLTLQEIFEGLAQGQYRVSYRFHVIEGMTVSEVVKRLEALPHLKGTLPQAIAEGRLYPDTYTYFKGDSRAMLLRAMEKRMEAAVATVWASRLPTCTVESPEALLTLASIVEKETSLAQERATVAGVYLTRLKKKIPLQADPTVVYGLSQGTGKLERALTKQDLKKPHPYNTYLNRGLPPTAIAIPSIASLKAVAQPQITGDLYFVATGEGGHVFSKTLANHQKHHQALRKWRRKNKA